MNKIRRKQIEELSVNLEVFKEEIETIQEEEQDYLDNIPDNLQESDRANVSADALVSIEYAIDSIQDAIENLNESVNN